MAEPLVVDQEGAGSTPVVHPSQQQAVLASMIDMRYFEILAVSSVRSGW